MFLDIHGNPLHTRALAVWLNQRGDGRLDTHAYIIDLRQRGFMPVAGNLQNSGIIHHMLLDAVVDPRTMVLDAIAAQQPVVAVDSSPAPRGESCRDPIERIHAIAGSRLDDDYTRRLSAEIGGPRGCSHLVTLAQLIGSTAKWAIARDAERSGSPGQWAPGERSFRRDLVLDGHETSADEIAIAIQLTDLHFKPAPPAARALDRFAAAREVRALAAISKDFVVLTRLEIAERERRIETAEADAWRDRSDTVAGLTGRSLAQGVTAEILARRAGAPHDTPVYDALLMLVPMMIQCMGAISEVWALAARQAATSVAGLGGLPDSCYIFRRGGAIDRSRA